jgi:hypothetical protein
LTFEHGGVEMTAGPRCTSIVNAFCRSFLHAVKRNNARMANLSCRAFLLKIKEIQKAWEMRPN